MDYINVFMGKMYVLVRTVLLSVIISGQKVRSPHRWDSHMHSRNEGKERRGEEERKKETYRVEGRCAFQGKRCLLSSQTSVSEPLGLTAGIETVSNSQRPNHWTPVADPLKSPCPTSA